jgi:transcriptional regulator with XRE-family HTH domain
MWRLSRQTLGAKFNEGARLLWLALLSRGWSQFAATHELGLGKGQLSKILYGDQRPGRAKAEKIKVKLGIHPTLWDRAPAEPFSPPAAADVADAASTLTI